MNKPWVKAALLRMSNSLSISVCLVVYLLKFKSSVFFLRLHTNSKLKTLHVFVWPIYNTRLL